MKVNITYGRPAVEAIPTSATIELTERELQVMYVVANYSCATAVAVSKSDSRYPSEQINNVLYELWRKLNDAGFHTSSITF